MGAELLTIPECPHAAAAQQLFERALRLAGVSGMVHLVVDSEEEAASLGFHGSPTFQLDGQDLFPVLGEPALTCRIYPTLDGPRGLPQLESLRTAIQEKLKGI
ncbi:hypothetical protein [Arthrobacter sp. StoSoilB13]|uniref:hypothetical protein n=1 Tax=Arthrobacter sp. StoSoilB13 TaxID=2830993 RepID=UPI001CC602C0|nr:hypothetical protein [Arthrobacter sp. StoSoilB13]BCW49640.1 hypothetical protein StoSoilB13_19820 [Arthrobacter sp. StoSoilB13]